MDYFVWLNAAVCIASPSSIAVVIHFPNMPVVISAEPSSKDWTILHALVLFTNTLPFNGRLYGMKRIRRQLVQVYPLHKHIDPVVAEVPRDLGSPRSCRYYLVESMGAIVVAVLHKISGEKFNAFALFRMDLGRQELIRVPSLGNQALFLRDDRCLSVSTKSQPSISSNCIYFAMPKTWDPVMVYSLSDGSFERMPTSWLELDKTAAVPWTSVRPYTLAHHLLTYCHHRAWARGLMFHELFSTPKYWNKRLTRKIREQDSEVVVPRLQGNADELKKLEIPDLFTFITTSLARKYNGNIPRLLYAEPF
ncbi:hypothetical protein BS78_02G236200 [Paspalum vaginatum]|nr:hypothetical protein BS78_02G236200 [Paspalum vaginatum]